MERFQTLDNGSLLFSDCQSVAVLVTSTELQGHNDAKIDKTAVYVWIFAELGGRRPHSEYTTTWTATETWKTGCSQYLSLSSLSLLSLSSLSVSPLSLCNISNFFSFSPFPTTISFPDSNPFFPWSSYLVEVCTFLPYGFLTFICVLTVRSSYLHLLPCWWLRADVLTLLGSYLHWIPCAWFHADCSHLTEFLPSLASLLMSVFRHSYLTEFLPSLASLCKVLCRLFLPYWVFTFIGFLADVCVQSDFHTLLSSYLHWLPCA